MNRRQRKKKKAQVFTIILGCTAFCKAEQYEKMRKSVEYQLRTGSSRRSSICDDMHSKSGVDNNSASMDIAVYDMEKGA